MMGTIHELIARGGPLYGAWASSNDPAVAEAMAGSGYDWLCLDSQHGALDWHDLLPLLRAVGGTPALVRVGWTDPMQIMRALDLGAAGVVVPMVSTVKKSVAAGRWPGRVGLRPARPAPPRCGSDPVATQDPSYRGRRHPNAEVAALPDDPQVTPAGVLPRQPYHQGDDLFVQTAPATTGRRIGPPAGD